jgi:hypothetical protein
MSEKKAATAAANSLSEMATNGIESGDKVERIRELIYSIEKLAASIAN